MKGDTWQPGRLWLQRNFVTLIAPLEHGGREKRSENDGENDGEWTSLGLTACPLCQKDKGRPEPPRGGRVGHKIQKGTLEKLFYPDFRHVITRDGG